MDKRKLDASNSSALHFAMPDMTAHMDFIDENGKKKPVLMFERSAHAIEFREDGIEFNVYAPDAKTVEVAGTAMTRMGEQKRPLEPVGDGWWRGVYSDIPAGLHFTYYFIDGVNTLYKYAPVCYAHSFVCNFVEVPDENVDFYDFKDVPHGAVRCEFYRSEYTGTLRNCWVYTPPSYDASPEKRYPVLYLQHGGGENETGWFWNGKIHFIMDNLIAAGECEEMIVVTNFGQAAAPDLRKMPQLPGRADELIIRDCVPFIDSRFRTIPEKSSRALAGLSMGAFQTAQASCTNFDTFDYFGVFSGLMGVSIYDFLKVKDVDEFNAAHKLLYFSVGLQEGGKSLDTLFSEFAESGIKAEGYTCDGIHEWQTWRYAARDFVKRLFKN